MTDHPRVHATSQFGDPTTTQDGLNCTPTSFVMLGELATHVRMWPGQFRDLQSDNEGGISIPDAARAWRRAYPSATLKWAAPNDGTPIPANRVDDALDPARAWDLLEKALVGMVIQGDYDVFEAAGISLQPGFVDPHAIYADGVRKIQRGRLLERQVYIIDPLGRGDYDGQWVDWNVVVRYGNKLSGGRGLYVAWASPAALPDTDTEEPMGLPVIITAQAPGVVTVKNIQGVLAIQLADSESFTMPPGSRKTSFLKGRVVGDPLGKDADFGGEDRHTVFIIGDEAAAILAAQVIYTPATVPTGDKKHRVDQLVDGALVHTMEV